MENIKIFLLSGILSILLVIVTVYKVNGNNCYVTFDTMGGNKIESKLVKKGDKVDIPKEPIKDGYTFIEWRLDGKKYNFSNIINNDITLVAIWEKDKNTSDNEKIEDEIIDCSSMISVGDKVTIIGEYAISSDGEVIGFSKAIGWEREIIAIYEGEEYPYQVGNEDGTTGFFKLESIEKDAC